MRPFRYIVILIVLVAGCLSSSFVAYEHNFPVEPFSITIDFAPVGGGQNFQINVVDLSRTKTKQANEQLDDFAKRRLIIIESTGLSFLNDEEFELSGTKARRITAISSGIKYQYVHLVYPESQKYYEIIYSADNNIFSDQTDNVDRMLESLVPKLGGFSIEHPNGWSIEESENNNY